MASIDLQQLIASGIDLAKKATDKSNSKSSSLGDSLKNDLYNSANKIQDSINQILSKGGLITSEEVDSLEEEIRLTKLKILEAESRQSAYTYTLYVFGGLTALGLLWYFTKEKTK